MLKKVLTLFLILCLALPLFACGGDLVITETDDDPTETASVTETESDEGDFTVLKDSKKGGSDPKTQYPRNVDILTKEKLEAFPIASADMTTDELRALCVDFFRFCQSFTWAPNGSVAIGTRSLDKATRYGGFPYQHDATANVYRYLEYMDEETGVLNMKAMSDQPLLFTNQCNWGSFWGGFGRVVNSANFTWTATMTPNNGFIPVGSYHNDAENYLTIGKGTPYIASTNGRDVMFASYALLKPADTVVNHDVPQGDAYGAGHIMMVSGNDPSSQTITIIDQFSVRHQIKDSDGQSVTCEGRIDQVYSYDELFENGYLPFTFAEFTGANPVEKSEVSITSGGEAVAGDTVTAEKLFKGTLNANYIISDVFLTVTDDEGQAYYENVIRAAHNTKVLECKNAFAIGTSASLLSLVKRKELAPFAEAGTFNVTITCRLANGELVTAYTGKLAAE